MSDDLISEFVDKAAMDALANLIETKNIEEVSKSGAVLASAFSGSDSEFNKRRGKKADFKFQQQSCSPDSEDLG